MKKRPHVLIFNPDQFRGDCVGHLGCGAARTPVMDRMAREEAVSFRWAFCQNPVCTPSRCSFMTGWYPHVRGHRTMYHMLHSEAGETHVLKRLKESGYFVWWGGKNDLVPGQHGYAEHCDVKYEGKQRHGGSDEAEAWRGAKGSDTWFSFLRGKLEKEAGEDIYMDEDWAHVMGAIELIKRPPTEVGDKPLCIYLPLGYPHPPYGVEEPYFSAIDRGEIGPRIPSPEWAMKPSLLKGIAERQGMAGWSEERWAELKAVYLGMCSRVDDQFGRVIAALKEAGIYDDTAIFMFSDHGDFTGDYGLVEKTQNTFEDVLTRVPFMIKPPKGVKVKPRVSEALVELVDFAATVYDVTGVEAGYTQFGRSLLPVVSGETDEHRDAVFCEGGRLMEEQHTREREGKAAKDPDVLYWPRVSLQLGDGPEHGKGMMCRTKEWKYVKRLVERDELYDLVKDPRELVNRIDDPALREVRERMRERLLTWMVATGDVVPMAADKRW